MREPHLNDRDDVNRAWMEGRIQQVKDETRTRMASRLATLVDGMPIVSLVVEASVSGQPPSVEEVRLAEHVTQARGQEPQL